MKRLIAIVALISAAACVGTEKQIESAERAAAVFACKVEVVAPYFDDIGAARAFVQDIIGRKVDPVAALLQLGLTLDEINQLGQEFAACSPRAEPAPEPAPRELVRL